MMKKKTVFFFLALAGWLVYGEIPLKEAIEQGIAMNAACRDQAWEVRSLENEQKIAALKKWFNLGLSASYLYKSEQMEIVIPPVSIGPGAVMPGSRLKAGAKDNYDLKLQVSQPLFFGNILSNTDRLQAVKTAGQREILLLAKIQAAAGIKRSYFQYRLYEGQMDSLQALKKRLDLHLQKLRAYFKEELITKSDLLETEARLKEQELNLEELGDQMARERIHFRSLCGLDIADIEKHYTAETIGLAEALAYFKAHHPLLHSLDQQLEALRLQEKIVNGGYLPHLAGFAEVHYGKPGIDFFANEWSAYFQGGISLDWKLFNWNKRKYETEIVRFAAEKVKNGQQDFIKENEKLLSQLYETRETYKRKLAVVKDLVDIAGQDIALKAKLLEEQQLANIDYLGALTQGERYTSMQNTILMQLELLQVNIDQIIGRFAEDR